MRVRGAPAIGISAAYGFYLGIKDVAETGFSGFMIEVNRVAEYLEGARPTAVNLKWALDRIKNSILAEKDKPIAELKKLALKTAITIHDEDKRICKQIGLNGLELVKAKSRILTHCNTGSLATGQYGTALSVIYHAHEKHGNIHVWVDETRPLLQGARLTAWELSQAGVPMTLIADSAAALLMAQKKVDLIIVGADRVTKNGDTANKIGTYSLAIAARHHNIPFYVALPLSTLDMSLESGDQIPIEERDGREITQVMETPVAPNKTEAYNPAFDITPAELITAFITEKGIIKPPYAEGFSSLAK
jgi:methylthioribose-1-phosphate isomerase